jgi:hypothetical protein
MFQFDYDIDDFMDYCKARVQLRASVEDFSKVYA